ncbi:hypothetical protein AB4072_08490 [Microvirga sp. 2MCAF38]|uniref:hypothetical protein n=1 Tax=Microvirga sp. 2MCAF38 TaxID=3232989 RepID=UPI003F96A09A
MSKHKSRVRRQNAHGRNEAKRHPPGTTNPFPDEFLTLAFNLHCTLYEEITSETKLRESLLGSLDKPRQKKLDTYLAEILSSRSDEEINGLWDKTGTEFMFFRPAAARNFLLKVREWLARDIPPPTPKH